MSKKITLTRELETTTIESVTIEVPDDFVVDFDEPFFDPYDFPVVEEAESIQETHDSSAWTIEVSR